MCIRDSAGSGSHVLRADHAEFFRGLPKAIEEAALVDGANWFVTMVKIYLPLSKPSLATVSLFVIVNHWNAWFDGLIYMNLPEKYPLMTYLQSVVLKFDVTKITSEQLMLNPNLMEVTGRGIKGALILLCTCLLYTSAAHPSGARRQYIYQQKCVAWC